MSSKLEDFVKSNREAFDDKEPPESVWNKIQNDLPARREVPWYDNLLLWRAAAVLFLAISVYLIIPKNEPAPVANNVVAMREFNDVEAFYNSQISQKVALIEEIGHGESLDEFTQDFQQLEAMYLVLKEDWKASPSKKVKDAMVLNLLVRINLLNQHLHRLEQELKKEDDSPSKSPDSST